MTRNEKKCWYEEGRTVSTSLWAGDIVPFERPSAPTGDDQPSWKQPEGPGWVHTLITSLFAHPPVFCQGAQTGAVNGVDNCNDQSVRKDQAETRGLLIWPLKCEWWETAWFYSWLIGANRLGGSATSQMMRMWPWVLSQQREEVLFHVWLVYWVNYEFERLRAVTNLQWQPG